MFRQKNKVVICLAIVTLICFCLCQYGLQRIFGFSLYPDEFGYWAPAASMLGMDWSDTLSLGSYYSFGYSVILAPILYFVEDSIAAYRTAVVVNMILQCVGIWLVYWLMKRLFPEKDGMETAIISGIAVLYPAWIFYVQMTMTEALLLFLYILIACLLLRFLKKPGLAAGALLSVPLVYIFMVHMRSIGIVAAGALTILLWGLGRMDEKNGRKVLVLLALLAVLFLAGLCIKEGVIVSLYHGTTRDELKYNDFTGQWAKVAYLFSTEGVLAFLGSLCAKLLYLGMATFGLAWRGLWYAGKRTLTLLNHWKDKEKPAEDFFWLFILLASLAQIGVSIIYTIGAADPGNERFDLFLHGRYSELIVPFLTAAGLRQLMDSGKLWKETAVLLLFTLFFGVVTFAFIWRADGMTNVHGYFMIGMSYLLKEENFNPEGFTVAAIILGTVLLMGVTLIIYLYRKMAQMEWLLFLILALQVFLGVQASEHYVYVGNSYGYMDIQTADHLEKILEEEKAAGKEGGRVIHLYEGGTPYIEQVQFRLRDLEIEVWNLEKEDFSPADLNPEDKVITQNTSDWNETMRETYEHNWGSGHLYLFYNG